MPGDFQYEFAIQEPALAIAPVFLALQKSKLPREKLDVSRTFGKSLLQWRSPGTLGIPEQSVLLALLAIAGQQSFFIDPNNAEGIKGRLLRQLSCVGPLFGIAVVITTWREIEMAAGYGSHGGNNTVNLMKAMEKLAKTTIFERLEGIESKSNILSWTTDENNRLIIALNRRNTDAIYEKQFVKISLSERNALRDEPAKALHAYLSGYIRSGSTKKLAITRLQTHVWQGEVTGSTARSREAKLRSALNAIGQLPAWRCVLMPLGQVEVTRINNLTIAGKGSIARRRDKD